jgi:hypothetical protein
LGKLSDKNSAKSKGNERGRILIKNALLFIYDLRGESFWKRL